MELTYELATEETARYILEHPRDIEEDAFDIEELGIDRALKESLAITTARVARADGVPALLFGLNMYKGHKIVEYHALGTPIVYEHPMLFTKMAKRFIMWGVSMAPRHAHIASAFEDTKANRWLRVLGFQYYASSYVGSRSYEHLYHDGRGLKPFQWGTIPYGFVSSK